MNLTEESGRDPASRLPACHSGGRFDPATYVPAPILCCEIVTHAVTGKLHYIGVSRGAEPEVSLRNGERVIGVFDPLAVIPFGEVYLALGSVDTHCRQGICALRGDLPVLVLHAMDVN